MTIILRSDQSQLKSGVNNAWNSGVQHVLGVLPTGGGKCLGKNTPILMFNGHIELVQNIKPGALVMGPDGSPRLVASVCSGLDNLYRITPVKGDSYIVNSQHVLSLKRTNEKSNPVFPSHARGGEIVNIPVQEYLTQSKWFKHLHKGWRTGIDFPAKQSLTIDPYWLGLWLGDGSSRTPSITTIDFEIMAYCYNYASELGLKIRCEKNTTSNAFNFHFVKPFWQPLYKSILGEFLASENLVRNKHIPMKYKTASRAERLRLLAGIIDTDGHYTGKGYDIVFKSDTLMNDVIYLARSLGFAAYKTTVLKTCTNTNSRGIYQRCNISGNIEQIPCILPRKKAVSRKQKKDVCVTGISVEPIGIGEYFGFEVIGKDRLFLLGDFTVTHNSVIVSDIALDTHNAGEWQCIVAHRKELVGQMSLHIGRRGIMHRIIGPDNVIADVTHEHRREFGRSFVNPTAPCAVAGVDTLISRAEEMKDWARLIRKVTIDEAHHVLRENKWGKAVQMFGNAHSLGVTASPQRADGMGLGVHCDGIYGAMIVGPTMRDLINMGALANYEIVIPDSDFHIDPDKLGKDGDFTLPAMREASKKSHIVGDVVKEYCKHAFGKRGITFATDVETAQDIAKQFNMWGIPAAAVSAATPPHVRSEYIRRFRSGQLWQLVNVDLFGEGFDLPAVEVVSMARPTASLAVYLQQFGRALRVLTGKAYGLIIDHVSNWKRHGFPDKPHYWSLDRREKRSKAEPDPQAVELTKCRTCSRPYEKVKLACPHCGAVPPIPEPGKRTLEQVDGDLVLLDRDTIERMQKAMQLLSPAKVASQATFVAGAAAGNTQAIRQAEKIAAQQRLKEAVAWWFGYERSRGAVDRETEKRFYLTMGMSTLEAFALSRPEMEKMAGVIEGWLR